MNKGNGTIFSTRTDWLKERKKGICSSDIAAIMGVSPFMSATDVWIEKTGRMPIERTGDALEWGKRIEPVIANYYRERHPDYILTDPGDYTIFHHPKYKFLKVTPDRFVKRRDSEWGLEIKTAGLSKQSDWGKDGTDIIPEYYLPQVMLCMAILDTQKWDVAVLIGGQHYREYTIKRDDDYISHIINTSVAWWETYIENDTTPPIDGGAYFNQYLFKLHSVPNKTMLQSNADVDVKLKRLSTLKKEIKDREVEIGKLEQELKAFIKDNRGVSGNTCKVVWSRYDENRTDWKDIVKQLPMEDDKKEALIANATTKVRKERFNFYERG